jgi:hypothetical protein
VYSGSVICVTALSLISAPSLGLAQTVIADCG